VIFVSYHFKTFRDCALSIAPGLAAQFSPNTSVSIYAHVYSCTPASVTHFYPASIKRLENLSQKGKFELFRTAGGYTEHGNTTAENRL
jgi:hypothetical protein